VFVWKQGCVALADWVLCDRGRTHICTCTTAAGWCVWFIYTYGIGRSFIGGLQSTTDTWVDNSGWTHDYTIYGRLGVIGCLIRGALVMVELMLRVALWTQTAKAVCRCWCGCLVVRWAKELAEIGFGAFWRCTYVRSLAVSTGVRHWLFQARPSTRVLV
jgi:hypothetical protein